MPIQLGLCLVTCLLQNFQTGYIVKRPLPDPDQVGPRLVTPFGLWRLEEQEGIP